jgi:hypothetical protein
MHRPTTRKALFLVIGLLIVTGVAAQEKKTKILLYKDRLAAQFDTVNVIKNVFKANPLLFLRGEIPFYYERALAHNLSLEVGFGVTLRDYLALGFTDDADDFGAGTVIVPNLSAHMAARFYLSHDLEPQGLYLQPAFAHLVYTKDIREKAPNGGFTDNSYRDERTYNDLRLLLGYQMLSGTSNWLLDFYGGLGYRNRNMVVVKETIDLTNQQYTYTVEETNDRVPVIFLGVKVGLGF